MIEQERTWEDTRTIDTVEVFLLYEFLPPNICAIIGYNMRPILVINLTGTMNTVTYKPKHIVVEAFGMYTPLGSDFYANTHRMLLSSIATE